MGLFFVLNALRIFPVRDFEIEPSRLEAYCLEIHKNGTPGFCLMRCRVHVLADFAP